MANPAKKKALPKGRHLSQIKRERQNLKRRDRNRALKSRLKTYVKKVREVVATQNKEAALKQLQETTKIIQKTVSKGVIHKNNAARRISRLAHLVNSIGAK